MRPYRGVRSWVPVCPSREHGGARPRLRSSLWSVLQCKTIPSLHPPACPAPPLACSRRANLASKHTHMSMEAYPPDGPQISPPQGSQNFSARVGCVARSVARARVRFCRRRASKTFAPSKLAAAPSLTRTDSVNQKSAMPPHACGGHQTQTLEMNTWPTIKRQHTRQSNSSA